MTDPYDQYRREVTNVAETLKKEALAALEVIRQMKAEWIEEDRFPPCSDLTMFLADCYALFGETAMAEIVGHAKELHNDRHEHFAPKE